MSWSYVHALLPQLFAAVLAIALVALVALPRPGVFASELRPDESQGISVLQSQEYWQGTDSDDGPDVVELTLLTLAASGIAAVIGLIGYLVRRGVGYDPHRPGPDDEPHH